MTATELRIHFHFLSGGVLATYRFIIHPKLLNFTDLQKDIFKHNVSLEWSFLLATVRKGEDDFTLN